MLPRQRTAFLFTLFTFFFVIIELSLFTLLTGKLIDKINKVINRINIGKYILQDVSQSERVSIEHDLKASDKLPKPDPKSGKAGPTSCYS